MKKTYSEFFRLLDTLPPLIFSLMVLSVVCMNILANKCIYTPFPWLVFDCGFLFSWLAFLTMDVLTHCYGPRAASVGSITAMLINLLVAVMFWVASNISGVWGESFVEGSELIINTALDNTIGGTWFVLLGSSIAFTVSALFNNFCNWSIGNLLKSESFGSFALRSYISTFLAQFVDNMTFALIVSHTFFGWTLTQCVACAIFGALVELVSEVIFSPLGYRISRSILDRRDELTDFLEA